MKTTAYLLTFASVALTVLLASSATAAITNLAPAGDTTGSDPAAFGSDIGDANDGNTNGNFGAGSVYHSTTTGPHLWQVDLGADALIDSLVYWRRTDGSQSTPSVSIDVFASSDLITPTYSTGTFSVANTDPNSFSFTSLNVTGQLVQVRTTGSILAFAELEVFGEFPEPPTAPEPSTFVLATLGLAGLVGIRRRRNR